VYSATSRPSAYLLPAKKSKSKAAIVKSKPKPKAPPPTAPSISAYRPVVSAEQEEALMSSILGNMDSIAPEPLPKKQSRKRKPSPPSDSDHDSPRTTYRRKSSHREEPSSDDFQGASSDDAFTSPNKRARVEDGSMTPATERLASLDVHGSSDDYDTSFEDINMDDFMDIDDDLDLKPSVKKETEDITISRKLAPKQATKEEPDVKPSWLSVYESLAVETDDTLGPLAGSSNSSNPSNISALEPDGSLRFFWLDYLELDGKLYFIGKLKDKSSGAWISCCVTVENIERNLYVLPREKRVEMDEEGEMHDTDVVPDKGDIHDDFDMIRKQLGIKSWRGKFVKRKYAFGEKELPRGESKWMKVVYGYDGEHYFYVQSVTYQ